MGLIQLEAVEIPLMWNLITFNSSHTAISMYDPAENCQDGTMGVFHLLVSAAFGIDWGHTTGAMAENGLLVFAL